MSLSLGVFWRKLLENLHIALRLLVDDRACYEEVQRPWTQMRGPERVSQTLVQERQFVFIFVHLHQGERF